MTWECELIMFCVTLIFLRTVCALITRKYMELSLVCIGPFYVWKYQNILKTSDFFRQIQSWNYLLYAHVQFAFLWVIKLLSSLWGCTMALNLKTLHHTELVVRHYSEQQCMTKTPLGNWLTFDQFRTKMSHIVQSHHNVQTLPWASKNE